MALISEKGLASKGLRGQAQCVLGNFPLELRQNYNELYRTQLRERRQWAVETLPELGQDVRRLSKHPNRSSREIVGKEQFIDALIDVNMRLRIKQARPVNLNDDVRHAVKLEAF